jgi:hypothetical protein
MHARRTLALTGVVLLALCGCTRPNQVRASGGERTIPQPTLPGNLDVAAPQDRVDTAVPTFSDPTNITNPYFPISSQRSVLLLGHVDGSPFRSEVTLLPYTRIVEWEGQQVETAVSQYNAFLDGMIDEIAYDYYAQADDGSVWYLGEDVYDFRDGRIIVTEGTWLAGRDGPAAMIMPATPSVGTTYRPENVPPLVFEEVTVQATGEPLAGPVGPVPDGLLVRELHMDGATEDKTFAPGYGEFRTSDGEDLEALALAVPTDATHEALPPELAQVTDGALVVVEAARSGSWGRARDSVRESIAAWDRYRTHETAPRLIEPIVTDGLERLRVAVERRRGDAAAAVAIEVARSAFDIQLRYRPPAEVELARMDLWAAQLELDAARADAGAVGSDAFALDYVRDRLLAALAPSDLAQVTAQIGAIQVAVIDEELEAAGQAASRLRTIVGSIALPS